MAIKFNNLTKLTNVKNNAAYSYKDLHLDFSKEVGFDTINQKPTPINDIQVSYDDLAIRNSIKNLFNTRPGQRFLFPLYGLDFYRFLFEPVSEDTARVIGETIVESIDLYEPRVEVVRCLVTSVEDQNMYEIDLVLDIIKTRTSFNFAANFNLTNQTFIVLQTSRNR